jgi:hypothetical protein
MYAPLASPPSDSVAKKDNPLLERTPPPLQLQMGRVHQVAEGRGKEGTHAGDKEKKKQTRKGRERTAGGGPSLLLHTSPSSCLKVAGRSHVQ